MNPWNPREFDAHVPALADGELDPPAHLGAMRHLAEHPQAVRKVLFQQQLRQRVGRVMAKDLPVAAPDGLRQRIAELARNAPLAIPAPGSVPASSKGSGVWSWGRWMPAAAAAMFFVAALVTLSFLQPDGTFRGASGGGGGDTVIAGLMPASHVPNFTTRHVTCSRGVATLHNTVNLPSSVRELPAAVGRYLGRQPYAVLDLSAMGYEFDRAGPCTLPGDRSVHLIYKAKPQTGRDDALSLWIEPDAGRSALSQDTPLHLTSDQSPLPMIVWRHAGMIYYLVGDSPDAVNHAVATLAAAESR